MRVFSLGFEGGIAEAYYADTDMAAVSVDPIRMFIPPLDGRSPADDLCCRPVLEVEERHVSYVRDLREFVRRNNEEVFSSGEERWIVAAPLVWRGKLAEFREIFEEAGYGDVIVVSAVEAAMTTALCNLGLTAAQVNGSGIVCLERCVCADAMLWRVVWSDCDRECFAKTCRTLEDACAWLANRSPRPDVWEVPVMLLGVRDDMSVGAAILSRLPWARLYLDAAIVSAGACQIFPYKFRQRCIEKLFSSVLRDPRKRQAYERIKQEAYDGSVLSEKVFGVVWGMGETLSRCAYESGIGWPTESRELVAAKAFQRMLYGDYAEWHYQEKALTAIEQGFKDFANAFNKEVSEIVSVETGRTVSAIEEESVRILEETVEQAFDLAEIAQMAAQVMPKVHDKYKSIEIARQQVRSHLSCWRQDFCRLCDKMVRQAWLARRRLVVSGVDMSVFEC